ncbi:MAG: hypothetical protein KA767_05265 [Saprospiraceae bacterium]|nr:hypothetical protein [Saprospiraceae bacterium]
MKNILMIALLLIFISSCGKDDKIEGICYCEFFSGDKSQYDLRSMSRQEQIAQCNEHDNNAANFVGHCDLE